VITLAEWEAVKEHEIKVENEEDVEGHLEETQEEVKKEVDEDEMLVLRRVLSVQKGAKDEQRESIFHSWCTVKGEVCSMIIDRGRYTNVASFGMIENLGLQATTHPHPYNIQWLNQSKGLQVNSRCLISFSIGRNYQV